MPLNLDRAVTLIERLHIRDRDNGLIVPFKLRPQQYDVIERAKEHIRRKRRLFIIFLKARRVGISELSNALGLCHAVAFPAALAGTVAQNREVAKSNFEHVCSFGKDLSAVFGRGSIAHTKSVLTIPHSTNNSTFSHYTAAVVHKARGLTFSSLHLTEAAFYPYEGVFTALMNTLSSDPNNMCLIETTANGMEGPGEPYYEYWQAAESGDNEFLPVFLPWYEDPAYIMDPSFAADAPRDEYERWLMNEVKDSRTGKKAKIDKARIAWFRDTLSTKCEGLLDSWKAEFPSTAEEAFVASGNPAFTTEEINFAKNSIDKPLYIGRCVLSSDGRHGEFQQDHEGPLALWELPIAKHHYFAGVDTARGEEANITAGDYCSIVMWNAETGNMAARYMSKVSPEELSEIAAALGYYFNSAMLNVELNGLGYNTMKELRDRLYYPTQYLWKGRDDKADPSRRGMALGFETSERYRRMMMGLFRTALHRKEVTPKDKIFVNQMISAKMEMNYRWNVRVGHDDVLMGGFLGWIAKEQNHPHVCKVRSARNIFLDKSEIEKAAEVEQKRSSLPSWTQDGMVTAFGGILQTGNEHLRKLAAYEKKLKNPNRILGV